MLTQPSLHSRHITPFRLLRYELTIIGQMALIKSPEIRLSGKIRNQSDITAECIGIGLIVRPVHEKILGRYQLVSLKLVTDAVIPELIVVI